MRVTVLTISTYLTSGCIGRLRGFLAFFLPGCVQGMVGNVVEPVLFGEKFDMHEVTVLASLTLWSVLWGVPGAVRFATRLPSSIRTIVASYLAGLWLRKRRC